MKKKKDKRFLTGVVDMTSSGAAYIVSPETEQDVFIPKERTGRALNGDTVKVLVKDQNRQRLEGRIVEIVSRGKSTYSGTVQVLKNYGFVRADSNKMPDDIFIPYHKLNGALDGQKVLVTITGWEPEDKNPIGEITEVLGQPGEHGAEMNSIIEEYGLPTHFPADVRHSAEALRTTISDEEVRRRKDFRDILTFTIDPVDAKDFDDAISLRKLHNGNWEVGVHIADVSHYVQEDSPIDREAMARATSVYLVDRVIPMLPEVLSNDACSLRPNEDKLCFSAVFELSHNAEIIAEWIGKTVIHSARRFNYEEVQEIIDGKHDPLSKEIHIVNDLARKLRAKRMREGSIGFEKAETKFKLDENGKPLEVIFHESNEAHELIEDFMLLANRRVSELIGKHGEENQEEKKKSDKREKHHQKEEKEKKLVFVYRVHDEPDDEKLQKFSEFLHKSGIRTNFHLSENLSASFNELIEGAKNKPYENIINMLAIRTMAKAYYSTKNIGHYGLGFDFYSHFTSPIRRYPDLLVHRLLFNFLNSGKTTQDRHDMEEKCKHCSKMERLAEEAERASIRYKQVQYLENFKGHIFAGLISGVTEFGMFVELKANKCEGLIRTRDMKDDFYYYDEKNYCLKGKRKGIKFQLGQEVMVKIKKTDLVRKYVDFELV
jgi:ribonuclease R